MLYKHALARELEMSQSHVRKQIHKLHKSIFTYIGIFMLIWVLSGIIISIPTGRINAAGSQDDKPDIYLDATISPAVAFVKVQADIRPGEKISALNIKRIQNQLYYVFEFTAGPPRIVAVSNGEYFKVTPRIAESIVRERYNIDSRLLANTILDKHNMGYPWGPLPVSLLQFDGDHAGADFYVNHQTGDINVGTLLTRAKKAAGAIHGLELMHLVTDLKLIRPAMLILMGLIMLVGVTAGLYLTLPQGGDNRKDTDSGKLSR